MDGQTPGQKVRVKQRDQEGPEQEGWDPAAGGMGSGKEQEGLEGEGAGAQEMAIQ